MDEQKPERGFSRNNNFTAEAIIKDFGGIRPMAAKLGIPVTTVQGWKSRGHIPVNRRKPILEAARIHNVNLSQGVLRELDRDPVTLTTTPTPFSEKVSTSVQFERDPKKPNKSRDGGVKKTNGRKPELNRTCNDLRVNAKSRNFWRSGGVILFASAVFILSGWFVLSESNLIQSQFSGSGHALAMKEAPALEEQRTESGIQIVKPNASKSSKETKTPKNDTSIRIAKETKREPFKAKIESIELQLSILQRRIEKINESVLSLAKKNDYRISQFGGRVTQINDITNKMALRIENLSNEAWQEGKNIALQALLLGQLENEIFAGRPYLNRLQSFRKSLPASVPKQIFEGLAKRAGQGVPTPMMLANKFNQLVIQRTQKNRFEDLKKSSSENIMERLKSELTGLFSIRKVGGFGKLPPLSMAEAAVANGDFVSAADHLESLSKEELYIDGLSSWVEDVRAHYQVQQHIEKLRWHVSALLGAEPEAN